MGRISDPEAASTSSQSSALGVRWLNAWRNNGGEDVGQPHRGIFFLFLQAGLGEDKLVFGWVGYVCVV